MERDLEAGLPMTDFALSELPISENEQQARARAEQLRRGNELIAVALQDFHAERDPTPETP